MTRLSSDISKLGREYQVVIVGSGYGGSIAASRLARAGQSVCLLERGRERWPGEFPDTSWEAVRDLQMHTPEGHHGNPTALFDLRAGNEISALVGCGLGGTSLINANVSRRPDDRIWKDPSWPRKLVAPDRRPLEDGFAAAHQMLHPVESPPEASTLKLAALEKAARVSGVGTFSRVPINVAFKCGVNYAGVHQEKCNLCGDCCTGCNVGAKTTTLMTYLPDAYRHGAKIFTEVKVTYLEPADRGWIVHFELLGVGRERFHGSDMSLRAEIVILAAGTYGSTEILLRTKENAPSKFSDRIGQKYTGNGDVLAFAFNTDDEISGVGFGDRVHRRTPVGPCIQGIVDTRETGGLRDGHVIEEGAIPGAIGIAMPAALEAFAVFHADRSPTSRHHYLRDAVGTVESFFGGPRRGAVAHTLTYLVMGHDGANGTLELVNDHLRVSWPYAGHAPTYAATDALLRQLTVPLNGKLARDPLWSELFHWRLMTVHPLGGCAMANSAEDGVVDDECRVFSGTSDANAYDTLYVMDGSVIPTSLGVNPLFTISAIAERACKLLCNRHHWEFDTESRPEMTLPASDAVGVRFTETMHGSAVIDGVKGPVSFIVTIEIADVLALEKDPGMVHHLVGTVSCRALGETPRTIEGGTFRMFVEDPAEVEVLHMEYHLPIVASDGRRLVLDGVKTIKHHSAADLWHDTTTLVITIRDDAGAVVGDGEMKLTPIDFAHQMRTMEVIGTTDPRRRLETLAMFGRFFGHALFEQYGSIVAPASELDPDAPPRKRRPLEAPVRQVYNVVTEDGVTLRLTRFDGGKHRPVLLVHGLGVSSEIFSTDLIETNLVEYLTDHGYDVWLLDLRVSVALASAYDRSTADDVARYDFPAAIRVIKKETGADSIQAVVHCYGSNTFFMSMLAGWTTKADVRSVVCSQVAAHLHVGMLHRFEAGLHLPGALDALGVDRLTAYVDKHADWKNRLFDLALRVEPGPFRQHCRSAVCHRVSFIYSLLYQHEKLDALLHDNLHELFGVANIASLEQLATMVRRGHVVAADGSDIYLTDENIARMNVPIRFIFGTENRCYHPESTEQTLTRFSRVNGAALYDRFPIEGYGHIDCIFGAHAVDDVYPKIVAHLDTT